MSNHPNNGYNRVRLYVKPFYKFCSVHKLVVETYIENLDDLSEVNHKDMNKANNNVDNLEWVTRSQNLKHVYKSGRKTITNI